MTPLRRAWAWAEQRPDRAVLGALVVASVARLVYVGYLGDDLGGPDSNNYDAAAWDLARRGLLADDVSALPFWAPGYPILVAGHYAVFGHHPLAVQVTQVAAIALLTWLAYRLAVRAFGGRTGLLVGLGMSASLAWLALPHPLMYEPWVALFLVGALLLLLRHDAERRPWDLAGAGLLLGAACAFQAKFVTLVPFLALWLVLGRGEAGMRWRGAAVLAAAAAAVVAVVVARNQAVYGEPILVSVSNGANLLYGNHPSARGGLDGALRPPPCRGAQPFATDNFVRTDARLARCALREALAHPGHTLALLPRKLVRLWAPYAGRWRSSSNWRHPFDPAEAVPDGVRGSGPFRALHAVGTVAWGLGSFALALLGAAVGLRQAPRAAWVVLIPILWLSAVHLATFGDPRFRVPVLPLVLALQCVAVVALAGRWRSPAAGRAA